MNEPYVKFSVPGSPRGKGRPKFARRGKFIKTYTDKETASYENLVKMKAADAMEIGKDEFGSRYKPLLNGAVKVRIRIFVLVPKSYSKKQRSLALEGMVRPTTKPDIDNVIKIIFDAINGVVWLDDKQVVDCRTTKFYSEHAGVRVSISPIETISALEREQRLQHLVSILPRANDLFNS